MIVTEDQEQDLVEKLSDYFGYGAFRGNQEVVIQNLLRGNDTFVIMPTGAGKSLCYQLPGIIMKGTAIVVSPLIALMKNQVDQLTARGINAHFLNSTLSKAETTKIKKEVLAGEVKLLYVAPESLCKEENLDFLTKADLSFVAIDEVHCISEWGHDFRPEYRRLKTIIQQLGKLPVIALTATATPKVQLDIQKNLHMDDAMVFKSSFYRSNLIYEVYPKINAKKNLIKFIKSQKGRSGIIYCLSRKKVEELAEFLRVNDVRAVPYHAGLDNNIRMANQDAFLNEDVDVVVATIAFGMGIDKPDVRYVIHYDAPKSLESYYQETGRAGRDGQVARCIMYYSYSDILKLEKFSKDKTVMERENAHHLLEEMSYYAESSVCRTRQLLHYFGEHTDSNCGHCDNCTNPKPTYDATEHMKLVLEATLQTGQKFPLKHIAEVIKGVETPSTKSYEHDALEVYGKGKDEEINFWISIMRHALLADLLEKDVDHVGVYLLTKSGLDFIKHPTTFTLAKDHEYPQTSEDEEDISDNTGARAADATLYEMLKALRKEVAKQKKLPPYVVFLESSLEEMATVYPTNMDDLTHIHGVGAGKAAKFGKPFLELINKYVEENDIDVSHGMFIKSSAGKSKNKVLIIQQIDRKVDLEDIADSQGKKMPELIEEIEHICYSGTKLNLDYYIESILDDDRQEEIMHYFLTTEIDSIEDAVKEFEDEYTEEELRLMRVKFLSEMAN